MTISIGNLFSIFIFTIFLSCFNNTHRFMESPLPPSTAPNSALRLQLHLTLRFDVVALLVLLLLFLLFFCTYFLVVFFFHCCCCCCCCFGCNTRNSFLFTLSPGKTILSGPKSETCSQSRELPLYLSLSLSLLLPRMHCGFCCIIIMLRLHPLPPGLTPSPFHTPH